MIELNLTTNSDDPNIVVRSKKSLINNFKVTNYAHIDKAVWLALYLYFLNKTQEAIELLESFVNDVEYSEEKEDLWGSNGNGVLLLAYINRKEGKLEKENKLVNIIINEDIFTNRTTRGSLLREEFDYYKERMELHSKETHKYRCEILGEIFFTFLYFLELLPTYSHEISDNEANKISEILTSVEEKLTHELKGS